MKRLFFILALLFPICIVQATSVNDMFKKYKKIPQAQYKKVKGKELRAQIDNVTSEEEKEVLRTAKEMQMLLFFNEDEDWVEKVTTDLNSLENYSLALSFTHNNGKQSINVVCDGNVSSEAMNGFIDSFINPTMSVDVYGDETSKNSDIILKPLFLINFSGMIGLVYLDGEIKASEASKVLKFTTDTDTTIKVE